jgi:hypothetical protein
VSRNSLHAWIDLRPQILDSGKRRHFSDTIISIPGASGFFLFGLRILGFKNIHFRSHNAEFFHRREWLAKGVGFVEKIRLLENLILGTVSDFLVAFFSSTVLIISKVELEIYWNRLFPLCRKKFIYFPYKPPFHLFKIGTGQTSNQRFVLIVGAFNKKTLVSDADNEFLRNGERIRNFFNLQGLELHSIGSGVFYNFCDVNWGYVEHFDVVMKSAEFVLVPTSKGWGFKTKILDALFNNIGVIMSKKLAIRSEPYFDFYSIVASWSLIEETRLLKPSQEVFVELRRNLDSQRSEFYRKFIGNLGIVEL